MPAQSPIGHTVSRMTIEWNEGRGPFELTTECGVKDDVVVTEVVVDVAGRSALKRCGRVAPCGWVWRAARNAIGNIAAAEKPDVNCTTGPFHRVNAPVGIIEAIAKGIGTTGLDPTTLVAFTAFRDH